MDVFNVLNILGKIYLLSTKRYPPGYLHDCSGHNANLLQLPACQTRHQGGDQERPLCCQAHPQAHWRVCIQDLRPLGEEGTNSEQSSTFREHSQSHPAVDGGRGRRAGPPHLVTSTSGHISWNFMGLLGVFLFLHWLKAPLIKHISMILVCL